MGIHVEARKKPLRQLKLGLPVATSESPSVALESLRQQMSNPRIAGLIFAREDVVHGGELTIQDDSSIQLLDIDRPSCTLAEQPRDKHFSLWTIVLAEELAAGQTGYLRIRFHLRGSGRLWLWERSFLAKNRAIVDLRLNDEREAQSVADISEFTSHLLPLEELDAFVIAPAPFNPSVTTPQPAYVRALEGRVWEKYLDRRTDLRSNQKFLVHHWESRKPVTTEAPFRGFIQLERRRSLLPSWSDLLAALFVVALAALLFELSFRDQHWAVDTLEDCWHFIAEGFPNLSGLYVVIGVLVLLAAFRTRVQEATASLRGLAGRIDRKVYSSLPPHD